MPDTKEPHEEIRKIESFKVDHTRLSPGIYISRVDGDVVTYDLRTRFPNGGNYMDNVTMHTVEHMVATYIRNSEIGDKVIYFGPMGCRTGFYLLVRDTAPESVLAALMETLQKVVDHRGPVFGASEVECGNFRELALPRAKAECLAYLWVLKTKSDQGKNTFRYE